MELPTGTIVDSAYRISAPLRLGRDVDIYAGEPIANGPPVMIHVLRTALMTGDPGLEIFERAGLELCRFSHDAFPEVVDYGRFMVRPYLVTEYLEARSLAEIIAAGELGSDRALRILNETRKALQAAHREGMAHGALSTESVFVTEDGEIKIMDLYSRWIAHQIATKGAPIDTTADLHALIELSPVLMKSAKRVTVVDEAQVLAAAPANITDDLSLEGLLPPPPPAPPAPPAPQRQELTPEPAAGTATPPAPTVVQLPPPPAPAATPIARTAQPAPIAAKLEVRLPPPPARSAAQPAAKALFPTPQPVRAPAPVAPRVAVARVPSFVEADLDLADEALFGPQLQPSYVEFFKRMFAKNGLGAPAPATENSASRSFNLLLTCSVALLMLAAVLRF